MFGALAFGHPGFGETEAEAKAEIKGILEGLVEAEKNRDIWASDLLIKIQRRAATCKEIEDYNSAAVNLLMRETQLYRALILGGMPVEEAPAPPFPTLFADNVTVTRIPLEGFSIKWTLPSCRGPGSFTEIDFKNGVLSGRIVVPGRPVTPEIPARTFPDYDMLKMWGGGQATPISETIRKSPQLTGFGFIITAWAAGVLLVLSLVAVGMTFALILTIWKRDRRAEADLKANEQKLENNALRLRFVEKCADSRIQVAGGIVDVETSRAIYAKCAELARGLAPPVDRPRFERSSFEKFGIAVLWLGLGAGSLAGGYYLYQRAKERKRIPRARARVVR